MNEHQPIVDEYFQKQAGSGIVYCIYEEKPVNQEDLEWLWSDDEKFWYTFKKKKYRECGDTFEKYIVVTKAHKTFSNKCCVEKLSFEKFMLLDYLKYHKYSIYEEIDDFEISRYVENYKDFKNENADYTLDDYHQWIDSEYNKIKKRERNYWIGCGIPIIIIIILPILYVLFVFMKVLTTL